ncbi:MAG: acyl--CoA ligase [Actinobacteria bacterium]|nr:acyl--CoA ligase [Actinomycetota bacterium]
MRGPAAYVEVATMGDVLARAATRWPDRDALVFPDLRRTYAELYEGARRSARSLLGLGIRPGERIGLLMPNCLDFVETVFGAAFAGIPVLTINARFKVRELSHVLEDADLVAVVTTDLVADFVDFAQLLADSTAGGLPPRFRRRILLGASSREGYVDRAAFVEAAEQVAEAEVDDARRVVRLREEAVMMYTSGTTANPKGCPFTHEAIVQAATAIAERFEISDADVFWDPLPMYHLAGLELMLTVFWGGATFLTQTHWDPAAGLRLMDEHGATWCYPTFPTFVQDLIHHPDFATTDLSRIRAVNAIGTPEALRDVQSRFENAILVAPYGITEGGGCVSFGRLDDPLEARISTGGPPLRCTQVRVVDPETDEELPVGEVGEIVLRGSACSESYYKDPEKTAEAWRGGWFHTGDLGRMDEAGRIAYVGRSKDMLKVGGENVAALEIEDFLGTHPAVKLAQVVAIPDARYAEVPAAFVELAPSATATEDELIAFCTGQISSFKIPRHVRFVDEWPMSATKIQKFRLREALMHELGLE